MPVEEKAFHHWMEANGLFQGVVRLVRASPSQSIPKTRVAGCSGHQALTTSSSAESLQMVHLKPPSLFTSWFMFVPRYGCGDGSECNTEGCCSTAGGLARCPPNLPRMCEAKTCGSHLTEAYFVYVSVTGDLQPKEL